MPYSLLRPSTTLNIVGSIAGGSIDGQRVLIIGEVGATATAPTDIIQKDIKISNLEQFGLDSQLVLAIQKFKKINEPTPLDVLPIPTGTAQATTDITVANDAIADSKIKISIGNQFKEIVVKKGDTTDIIAGYIETAYTDDNIFDVSRAGNVVTLTAKQSTASINNVSVFIEDTGDSGTNITGTDLASGASNTLPDDYLTTLATAIDERYQSIIFDYANGTNAVRTYLEDNFNLLNDIKDGVGFATITDTMDNFKTALEPENYKSLVLFGNLAEMRYDVFPLVATAEIVAIRALRLTEGAVISKYVIGSETKGSIALASLPYFNTPLSFPQPKGCITETQLLDIIKSGGTIWTYNGITVLSEVVTTYKTDNGGNSDVSWKYLNYVDTMSVIREYFVKGLRARYGQVRLTDGDLIAGRAITNKGAIKATLLKLYDELAKLALTRLGYNKAFADTITLKEDLSTGRVSLNCKVPIVTQLRTIYGNIVEVLDISAIF